MSDSFYITQKKTDEEQSESNTVMGFSQESGCLRMMVLWEGLSSLLNLHVIAQPISGLQVVKPVDHSPLCSPMLPSSSLGHLLCSSLFQMLGTAGQ